MKSVQESEPGWCRRRSAGRIRLRSHRQDAAHSPPRLRDVVSLRPPAWVASRPLRASVPRSRRHAALADIVLAGRFPPDRGHRSLGSTLSAMLSAFELHEPDRQALVSAIQRVFDVRRLRVGQPFKSRSPVRRSGPQLRVRDRRRSSRTCRRRRRARDIAATVEPIDKDITVDAVEGRISSDTPSLTQALDAVGERIDLALQMADIFSGELDFSSELQPGDSFRLVIERQMREGVFVGYGAILAAEFVASGRRAPCLPLCDGRRQAGLLRRAGPLAEALLPEVATEVRAPHHLAILVVAQPSDPGLRPRPQRRGLLGAERRAGRLGGAGHGDRSRAGRVAVAAPCACVTTTATRASTCTSPPIDVRAGEHVSQGELVGKVGATGLATAPHLHYGLARHGSFVNPVRRTPQHAAGRTHPGSRTRRLLARTRPPLRTPPAHGRPRRELIPARPHSSAQSARCATELCQSGPAPLRLRARLLHGSTSGGWFMSPVFSWMTARMKYLLSCPGISRYRGACRGARPRRTWRCVDRSRSGATSAATTKPTRSSTVCTSGRTSSSESVTMW